MSACPPESAGRRRVVHLTPGLEIGGLERLLVEFARHADRARFDLHVVSLGPRGPLAAEVEACGWPVTALGVPDGLRPGLVPRLAGLFRRLRADVVHTHDDRAHVYGAPAARLARVRRIVHTRHCRGDHTSRRQRLLIRLATACTDRFVCVSEDGARRAAVQGVPAGRLAAVWNGIDTERFAYAGPAADGPVVAVARLSPEKDLDGLVKAVALARREDPALELEIAGDGPCAAELREQAAGLGLGGRVRFLGAVRDVPAVLARAGLFVLPSRTEGISLTLLEAMARGLPVVATRVGGNVEVVVEGETGLLVEAGNPEALAAALLAVRRAPERGRRMGQAGRARVEQLFDVRRMVACYESLYVGNTEGPRAEG